MNKAIYSSRDTNNLKVVMNIHKAENKEKSYFLEEISCADHFL